MCYFNHWRPYGLVTCRNTIALRTAKGVQLYEYTDEERLVVGRYIELLDYCLREWTLTNNTLIWLDNKTQGHQTVANMYRLCLNTLRIDTQDCSLEISQPNTYRKMEAS